MTPGLNQIPNRTPQEAREDIARKDRASWFAGHHPSGECAIFSQRDGHLVARFAREEDRDFVLSVVRGDSLSDLERAGAGAGGAPNYNGSNVASSLHPANRSEIGPAAEISQQKAFEELVLWFASYEGQVFDWNVIAERLREIRIHKRRVVQTRAGAGALK